MINLREDSNTRTTTAVTISTEKGQKRFYHVGNSERINATTIKLAKNNSLTDLSVSATELQEFLYASGRAYKAQAHELAALLFGLGYDLFHCEIADLKAAKSRRQVDIIIEDVVYTLCAAYIIKRLDDKYVAVSSSPTNAQERIQSICKGIDVELTEQQASNLLELAFRKNKKGDTSADWKAVLKYCCKVIANQ